jgi:alkanesulfonate monooxygenase SsuD/methylene tetrahydromethanopterin reductase-like flavin-dependent oxidoreductase (luciferase family)
MLIDASLPPAGLRDIPAIARAAEQAGFSALWSPETMHDPFLASALIAEYTTRLQFGTGIAVAFARSPATMAYSAWDLAQASQGRFILGLGTQVKAHITAPLRHALACFARQQAARADRGAAPLLALLAGEPAARFPRRVLLNSA